VTRVGLERALLGGSPVHKAVADAAAACACTATNRQPTLCDTWLHPPWLSLSCHTTDLVFLQNGMLQPWLDSRGLGDNTQVGAVWALAWRCQHTAQAACCVQYRMQAALSARVRKGLLIVGCVCLVSCVPVYVCAPGAGVLCSRQAG
jgi:hypothetical protein